jgi:cellobionic acid phosphorylase
MEYQSKFGGFEENGGCYVITTPETPRPWEHYLYSGDGMFQAIITQRGEGLSFYDSDKVNRVSNGRNFVVMDGSDCWSINGGSSPQKSDVYRCEYRLGSVIFYGGKAGIESKLEVGLALEGCLELNRLTLKNTSGQPKTISIVGYHKVDLNGIDNWLECQFSKFVEEAGAICCQRRHYRTPKYKYSAYFVADRKPVSYCGSLLEFLGGDFSFHDAKIWTSGTLPKIEAHGTEPILALQHQVRIEAGQSLTLNYAFGLSDTLEESAIAAGKMKDRWQEVPAMFAAIRETFDKLIAQNEIQTPDPIITMAANVWCKYQLHRQTISARSTPWFNWRNHIQDAWAFMLFDTKWEPHWLEKTCQKARADGFLPRASERVPGVAFLDQRHPDIATWAALCAARYFTETGDRAFFRKKITYAGGKKKATILDCLSNGLQWLFNNRGKHGMVLLLDGDWSDPLEEAGKKGIGESPWTSMALINAVVHFAPLMRKLGMPEKAKAFESKAKKLSEAVNKHAWDGRWYIRGIDDSGKPFCTAKDPDGNVSLLMQSWAIISGIASPEHIKLLTESVDKWNKTEFGPIIYGPAFLTPRPWIGRETAKPAGTCVNGSVYNHVAMMWVMAEFMLGRPQNGLAILRQVLPLRENDDLEKRKGIPVWMPNYWHGPNSKTPGRVGEAMTSAAAPWFFLNVFEHLFGLRAELDGLHVQPCFPEDWEKASCKRSYRGFILDFEFVRNPSKTGITLSVNGKPLEGQIIPAKAITCNSMVKVTLGRIERSA